MLLLLPFLLLLFCLNLPPLTDQMPQAVDELEEMYKAMIGIVDLVDNNTDGAMTTGEVDLFMDRLEPQLQQGHRAKRPDERLERMPLLVALGGLVFSSGGDGIGASAPSGPDPLPRGIRSFCAEVWSGGFIIHKHCTQQMPTQCFGYNESRWLCLRANANDDGDEDDDEDAGGTKMCAQAYARQPDWFERFLGVNPCAESVMVCTSKRDATKCYGVKDTRKYGAEKLCVVTETRLTQWCREAREDKQRARKNIREGLKRLVDIGDANGDGKLTTHREVGKAVLTHKKKKELEFALEYVMCGLEGLGYYGPRKLTTTPKPTSAAANGTKT